MNRIRLGCSVVAAMICASPAWSVEPSATAPMVASGYPNTQIHYRIATIEGFKIAYREAGPSDAPTIVFLHGFPSSSRMFENLFPLLSDKYHLVAPDLPGFGHSDAPPASAFAYTFDNMAVKIDGFLDALKITRAFFYLQDYGGYVGMRLATARPERVAGLIVQNSIISRDGLREAGWKPRELYWADHAANAALVEETFFLPKVTEGRHRGQSPNPDRYNPDLWTDELAYLARPGVHDIQLQLYDDYKNTPPLYPKWQHYLAERKPATLVAWGKFDPSFTPDGAEAYKKANPSTDIHFVNGGHFALDEAAGEIAVLIRGFIPKVSG